MLEVEGSLSIGGRYVASSGGTTSYMSGDYGQLQLADSSRIEVKNGGSLYAWGFVSGGSVTVEARGNGLRVVPDPGLPGRHGHHGHRK